MIFAAVLLATLTVTPQVIDGDNVRPKARLYGIDAPESRQQCLDGTGECYPCGEEAKDALAFIVGPGPLECAEKDTDRYGRAIVQCRKGQEDVGDVMISSGWAIPYRRYLTGELAAKYEASYNYARENRLGIHRGKFVEPEKWRRGERLVCE